MTHTSFTGWHKSSYSSGEGENCVIQGADKAAGLVGVADTKLASDSPVLAFGREAWLGFIADVRTTAA
ncbi:DUF397 domain-containing protein [Streptomyces sp. NPDC021080]|uniref:DUF397 domain-containing protein n=1 Tax=Streptomyces sp. NPDC021080 TaxID=3365110 RepID=UPI0037BC64AD